LENANRGIGSSRVAECILTTLGGDGIGASGTYNNTKQVIGLEFDILGETLNFQIGIGKDRANLADIVPLARTVCTGITNVVVKHARSDGARIPCCEGCSACCSRYLVPLSVPEALRFNEEISAAPAYRRESIWSSCLLSARLILSQKPPKPFMRKADAVSPAGPVDLNLISNWYMSLKLRCPFLYNHTCSIYDQRPLACREHFITGSVRACRGQRGFAEVVEMPVQMPNVLGQLAGELEGTPAEAVILPLALVWGEENLERAERTWPTVIMVERFAEIVKTMASRSLPPAASQRTIIGLSKKRPAANQLCRSSSG